MKCHLLGAVGALAVGAILPEAWAQEAILTPAATSPAKGRLTLRTQLRYTRFDDDPTAQGREGDELTSWSRLSYGVTGTISLNVDIALTRRRVDLIGGGDADAQGVGDLSLSAKWRVWQSHTGAIDTARFALIGGVELPTGTGDLSSHSVDPFVGGVLTLVRGRHGVNQGVTYKLNTGTDETPFAPGAGKDDAISYDTAYLYRLSPREYESDTTRAWYATVELNGLYETGGDHEILISPGLLLEAKAFAVEAAVMLPVYQRMNNRPGREWGLVLGVRWLF